MAHDLAARLLPAFENTSTGIPHPRVRVNFNYLAFTVYGVNIINELIVKFSACFISG